MSRAIPRGETPATTGRDLSAVKERLRAGRERLAQMHAEGELPAAVSAAWTEAIDTAVLELYEAAESASGISSDDGSKSRLALVAIGGYGRRDMAPFSDVDLMLLVGPQATSFVEAVAPRLLRELFDVGLQVGHSVRTVDEALKLAATDATVCTALAESRRLGGDGPLFDELMARLGKQCARRRGALIELIDRARHAERIEFGDTVYLLEPNVKRSPGALRDVQFLRWLSYLACGSTDVDALEFKGLLSSGDVAIVVEAGQFLLRLRVALHLLSGKSGDVLDRRSQVRLAEQLGYVEGEGLLAVERLMRDYFRRTSAVRRIAAELLDRLRPRARTWELAGFLLSHQMEGDFRVGPREITVTRRGQQKLSRDLSEALRLADLANLLDKRIGRQTHRVLRDAAPGYAREPSTEAAQRFLSLLEQPTRLAELLRTLHELEILEALVPGFAHARGLLQFNEYHKYTVDEHCLRAVGCATDMQTDPGPLGEAYRALRSKRTLHLALLIHDLGKGYPEDHSEVGRQMAEELAVRLGLAKREAETLVFLVHRHLMMSHLAFRRDTSDEQLVVRFAVDVGSPERLQMLYLLTAADLASVGPGVWTPWKADVLTDLFRRTMRHLAGTSGVATEIEMPRGRGDLVALLARDEPREWFEAQWAALSPAYREAIPAGELLQQLRTLRGLATDASKAEGRFVAERGTVEYTVMTSESVCPGIFHRLTGALSGQGLEILSAEINTLVDGRVLDRFSVLDPDHAGQPPQGRIHEVCRSLVAALDPTGGPKRVFRRTWRPAAAERRALSPLTTQVRIDNSSSQRFTVIDVFAADAPGLLYAISRTLFELELSVSVAKIGTYLDQVVDVFYVSDLRGGKVEDEGRLEAIRARLQAAVEEVHGEGG